jgi:aspartyl-tRNA(Asn)/glutamyl-tRNA(Gln) amidotransferase subunit A
MVLSWSMDHLGPLAWTARDAALMLTVMTGRDPADATASRRAVPDDAAELEGGIKGVRIGLPENYLFEGVDEEIAVGVRQAARQLESLGERVSEIRVPDPTVMTDVSMLITRAGASTVHARMFRERPHDLQPVVRARLQVGYGISAYDYLQALRLRAKLTRAFVREVFAEVDVLLTPVIPESQPALAALKAATADEFNTRAGRFSRLTRPFKGLGLPFDESLLLRGLRARNEISVPDERGLAVNVFDGWWPRRQFDDGSD